MNEVIRILILVDSTEHDMRSSYVARLMVRLQLQQTQAVVCSVAPFGDGAEAIQGTDTSVVSLDLPRRRGLRGVFGGFIGVQRLREVLVRYRPDVLFTIGARAAALGRFGAAMERTIPVVSMADDDFSLGGFGRIGAAWGRRMMSPAINLVDEGRRFAIVLQVKGRSEECLGHVPRGIEVASVSAVPPLDEDRLGTGFIDVGLPVFDGDTDVRRDFLDAFRVLAAYRKDIRLCILAREREAKLDSYIKALGLDGRVVHAEIGADASSAFQRMHMVWLSGRRGPDPDLLLTALCVGTPVVMDHRTSFHDDIAEIGGALMRDINWPNQFAEASREIIDNPDLHAALGQAGKIVARERYGFGDHVTALRGLLGEVAARSVLPRAT